MFQMEPIAFIRQVRDLALSEEDRGHEARSYDRNTGITTLPAVIVSLDGRVNYWNGGEPVRRSGMIHVLMCGQSCAFMALTDTAAFPDLSPERKTALDREAGLDHTWRNVSNHSSCWKDSIRTEINSIHSVWATDILEETDQAPRDLNTVCWPAGIGAGVRSCMVGLLRSETNGYPGGYRVVDVDSVKWVGGC